MADVHIAEKIIEKYRLKRSREFFGNDLLLPERIRDEKEMAGMDADQKHKSSEKEKEKAILSKMPADRLKYIEKMESNNGIDDVHVLPACQVGIE